MKQNNLQRSSDDFWKALEAERHDISYRKEFVKPETHVVVKTLNKVPERLKKIYYHAGRYAAGDRDELAKTSAAKMEQIEG